MDPMEFNNDSEALAELVRRIYLERQDAIVEIGHERGTDTFFFRGGELYLDRDHDMAAQLSPLLSEVPDGGRAAAHDGLRALVENLARQAASHNDAEIEIRDRGMFAELIGPLPTVIFSAELAVHGRYEDDLMKLLGGPHVKLKSINETPALQQLPSLEPEMAQMLVSCERPSSAMDLLRATGSHRLACLRGLVRLWAVGLVGPEKILDARGEKLVTPWVVKTFSERIASSLADETLDIPSDEHRERLATLMSHLGQLNHYELLELDPRCDEAEISKAYNRLARVVHPSHAAGLGLAGKEQVLGVLFERVTEAYLTLSDPMRRASYNTVSGIQVAQEVDDAKRMQEKQQLARQNYRRATRYLEQMDYSMAVDLLKESVRMDPQPEYYVRLGVAQSKNPNWQRHALNSFQRAIELSPDDAGVRTAYGTVLEHMERFDEARTQFEAALEKMPDHVAAREALERLGGEAAVGKSAGDFRSLFRGSRD